MTGMPFLSRGDPQLRSGISLAGFAIFLLLLARRFRAGFPIPPPPPGWGTQTGRLKPPHGLSQLEMVSAVWAGSPTRAGAFGPSNSG
jgi:hypothetical protein